MRERREENSREVKRGGAVKALEGASEEER